MILLPLLNKTSYLKQKKGKESGAEIDSENERITGDLFFTILIIFNPFKIIKNGRINKRKTKSFRSYDILKKSCISDSLENLDTKLKKTKTQNWSTRGRVFEKTKLFEKFLLFITITADNTTM